MRQLDLFGFFEPPQENKSEEKTAVGKNGESLSIAESTETDYSINTLPSESVAVSEASDLLNELIDPDKKFVDELEISLSSSPSNLSLLAETSIEKDNSVIERLESVERSLEEQFSEKQVVLESEGTITANTSASDEPTSDNTFSDEIPPSVPGSIPISVEEKKSSVSKPKKQKLPELQRSGEVIFDDGKITVKIKNKSPFPPPIIKEKKVKAEKIVQKRGRKSFKEIDAEVDLIEIPEDEILFQKQYYSISEVAKWFRVNTSLLRFWENEFDVLKPRKNRKGDRLFRPEDVKNLQLIYQLLRQRKYTIDGAKEYIKTNKKKADVQLQLTNTLQKFKSFLLDLKANL